MTDETALEAGDTGLDSPLSTPSAERILGRLGHVAATLSDAQKNAILRAFAPGWARHPVNIRLSLPWVGGRFFTTLVAGIEQREPTRRATERKSHPLHTVGNIFFAVGLGTIFYVGAVVALALQSAIIEL